MSVVQIRMFSFFNFFFFLYADTGTSSHVIGYICKLLHGNVFFMLQFERS